MQPGSSSQIPLPASLEEVRVKRLPSSAFYISDFITSAEEERLLAKIAAAPKPRWKQLAHRRLQTWPSDLNKNTLLESALPEWLIDPITSRLESMSGPNGHIFADSPHSGPNHVLINEYLPGQGILPHKDGGAYHPVVCTVSLGGSICLDIYSTNDDGTMEGEPRYRILQEPRSLLITSGDMYTDYLHGIAETVEDLNLSSETVSNWDLLRSRADIVEDALQRKTRTSLTYRDVIKVSKLGAKFAILGKR